MSETTARAAGFAQLGAQALTGVALLLTVLNAEVFGAFFLLAALAVTFRSRGTAHDRALSNFTAAVVVWGNLVQGILGSLLDSIGKPGGFTLDSTGLLLLTSAVLFSFAGAFFWIKNREGVR